MGFYTANSIKLTDARTSGRQFNTDDHSSDCFPDSQHLLEAKNLPCYYSREENVMKSLSMMPKFYILLYY